MLNLYAEAPILPAVVISYEWRLLFKLVPLRSTTKVRIPHGCRAERLEHVAAYLSGVVPQPSVQPRVVLQRLAVRDDEVMSMLTAQLDAFGYLPSHFPDSDIIVPLHAIHEALNARPALLELYIAHKVER